MDERRLNSPGNRRRQLYFGFLSVRYIDAYFEVEAPG